MPGPDITDLFEPMTKDEVQDSIYAILTSLDLPITSWQKLAVVRTIIATISQKLADFTVIMAAFIRSGFLDFATGAWLTLLAKSVYDEDRAPATFAQGPVTLTNASTNGFGPFAAGAFHVANPTTGKTYKNDSPFSIAPSSTFDIDVTADEEGSGSSSGPLAINALATPLIGVSCSNAAAILGSDGQADPDLRAACRAKLAALSPNGAADAYNFVAFKAPTAQQITRSTAVGDPLTGEVSQYLATTTGAPSGGDVAIVQGRIDNTAEPLAVLATAYASTETLVDVAGTIYIERQEGLTAAAAKGFIDVAIANYFKTVPIGGVKLGGAPTGIASAESIRAAALIANARTLDLQLSTPSANIALIATAVPKLGTSTIAVVFQ